MGQVPQPNDDATDVVGIWSVVVSYSTTLTQMPPQMPMSMPPQMTLSVPPPQMSWGYPPMGQSQMPFGYAPWPTQPAP
jgi:hypothetical protein